MLVRNKSYSQAGQANPINEFIIKKKVEPVGSCRFQIHLCIVCVMSRNSHVRQS